MKVAIRLKKFDEVLDAETDEVLDVVVLALQEPEGTWLDIELVEDDETHWANDFKPWRYRTVDLKETLRVDKQRRTAEWLERCDLPDTRVHA
jgi:hypothetical protein